MGFKGFWKFIISVRVTITIFLAIMGALWLLLEPLGIKPGLQTYLFLIIPSLLLGSYWLLSKKIYSGICEIEVKENKILELEKQIESLSKVNNNQCFVVNGVKTCPLGVTRIYNQTTETVESSLKEAKHSFKWLGYSAFNVVHNKLNIFNENQHTKFEFVILNPSADKLLDQVNKDFHATMDAHNQVENGRRIIKEITQQYNQNVTLHYHMQLPSFRLVLIDDNRALVSFYETGKDALKVPQIEIIDNPEAKYCLFNWFELFYDKVILTEKLLGRECNSQL